MRPIIPLHIMHLWCKYTKCSLNFQTKMEKLFLVLIYALYILTVVIYKNLYISKIFENASRVLVIYYSFDILYFFFLVLVLFSLLNFEVFLFLDKPVSIPLLHLQSVSNTLVLSRSLYSTSKSLNFVMSPPSL